MKNTRLTTTPSLSSPCVRPKRPPVYVQNVSHVCRHPTRRQRQRDRQRRQRQREERRRKRRRQDQRRENREDSFSVWWCSMRKESRKLIRLHVCVCVAVPTDDGRNSYVFNGARTTESTRTLFFTKNTKAIIVVCADPFSLCLARQQSRVLSVVRSCSLLSFLLDVSVRTFRPKAPQNQSPRDIHTLTTFWCYGLSFVA